MIKNVLIPFEFVFLFHHNDKTCGKDINRMQIRITIVGFHLLVSITYFVAFKSAQCNSPHQLIADTFGQL